LTRTWGSTSPTRRESTPNALTPSESPAADFASPRAISARVRWFAPTGLAYGADESVAGSRFVGRARTAGDPSRSMRSRTPPGDRVRAIAYDAPQTTAGLSSRRKGSMAASGTGLNFAAARKIGRAHV